MRTFPASLVACFVASWAGTLAVASDLPTNVDRWRAAHEAEIVGTLADLVRLPSVAADRQSLAACADRLEAALKARGFKTAQWTANGAPPAVFGEEDAPGAKQTVVFYAHYDGQPVTPAQWSSPPFAPVMRDGPLTRSARTIDWQRATPPFDPDWRLFGRAAADDKASIVAFLAAFDALRALHRIPSVNLKIIWEGEEEAGSPHLAEILKQHAAELHGDLLLIGDGPVHQSETPTLYFGARGSMDLEMTVYGPNQPLHDGHYGNWAPNPAVMAAELIASMRDSNGRILIPGFDSRVRPLTPAEQQAIANLPPVEPRLKREFGIGRTEGDEGLTASTMRPALNVRGIAAGAVGGAARNAIPDEATLSLDFRLVPDQMPHGVRQKVESFLKSKGWTIVSVAPDEQTRLAHAKIVRLDWGSGYPGLRTNMATRQSRAAIAAAEDAAGGHVAQLPMMGGSVPIYLFHDILQEPVIGLPIVNHDDSQHAPNENLRLKNLWNGIDAYAAMIAELGSPQR